MEEIIQIRKSEGGKDIVSARELYDYLGFEKSQWSRWIKKNIDNNPYAEENKDWVGFDIMSNGNKSKDYAITIDFAKRLSMLARTETGEKVRSYFIACEEQLRKPNVPSTYLEAIKHLLAVEEERLRLEAKIEQDAPKVEMVNRLMESGETLTVAQFGKLHGVGLISFFKWLRGMGYLMNGGSRHNQPFQKWINDGLFEVKEVLVGPPTNTKVHIQTFITPKGQVYLTNKYK